MDRTGLVKTSLLILLFVVGTTLLGAPAAQCQHRVTDDVILTNTNGEPTDPEEALQLLGTADIDVDFDTNVPSDEAEAQSWLEALIDLLRELGLLGDGDGDEGR